MPTSFGQTNVYYVKKRKRRKFEHWRQCRKIGLNMERILAEAMNWFRKIEKEKQKTKYRDTIRIKKIQNQREIY